MYTNVNFWCSHCGSTIFVGAGFSYALCLKVRRSTTRPHVEPDVDRPFSNGGQLMCHEVFIYVEDSYGSTWVSNYPAQNFCKRNVRTLAWVNNVISLHGS